MGVNEIYYNPFIKTILTGDKRIEYLFGLFKIREKSFQQDYPVDIVYLWVDGSDEKWLKNKNFYEKELLNKTDEQISGKGRYADNDELRYSLRSVEKYAPWINKIFIITDGQIPKWLDTTNPKIKIVFHKDFIPEENLPLFNSEAIETYFSDIPELSEHFIYANDDMFINKPIDRSFFYDTDGNPIVRLKHQVSKKQAKKSLYNRTILNAQKLIKEIFSKNIPYAPHHNMDSYRKSHFIECKKIYKTEFDITGRHKFRTEGDIQRVAVLYYALCQKRARLKLYSRVDKYLSPLQRFLSVMSCKYSADSIVINANDNNFETKLKKYNPKLFCINDGEGISDSDRDKVRSFLQLRYPQKSMFEFEKEI